MRTGCYADLTLARRRPHPAQVRKINALYECAGPPFDRRAPHRRGHDLAAAGHPPRIFPAS